MLRIKRFLALFAALTLLITLFASCASKVDDVSDSTTEESGLQQGSSDSTSEETSTDADVETSNATDVSNVSSRKTTSVSTPIKIGNDFLPPITDKEVFIDFGKKEFTIKAWWDGKPASGSVNAQVWKEVMKNFNVGSIKWTVTPDMSQYNQQIQTEILSSKSYDLVMLMSYNLIPFVRNGLIQPIPASLDINDDFRFFQKEAFDAFRYQDKYYGMVNFTNPDGGLVVNKTLIKAKGQADPVQLFMKDKWTWDEFAKICKGVTNVDTKDEKKSTYGFTNKIDIIWGTGLTGFIFSNGSDIIVDKNGKPTFNADDQKIREAFDFYYRLTNVDKVIPAESNDLDFTDGRFAFRAVNASFPEGYLRDKVNFEYCMLPFPKGPSAKEYRSVIYGAVGATIPTTAKNAEASARIYSYMIRRGLFTDKKGVYDLARHKEDMKRDNNPYLSDFFMMRMCSSEKDIDAMVKYCKTLDYVVWGGYGFMPVMSEIMSAITGGQNAATAIDTRKGKAQNLIDAVMQQ